MLAPTPRFIALSAWLLLLTSTADAAGPSLPKALADAPAVSAALNNILEIAKTGSRTRWEAPSGRYGFITINRTWFPKPDQPCREYLRSLVNPDGKPTLMHGTGCRDSNGLWMLLETQRGSASSFSSTHSSSDCPPAAIATPLPSTPLRTSPPRRSSASSRARSSSADAKADATTNDGAATASSKSSTASTPSKRSSKTATKSTAGTTRTGSSSGSKTTVSKATATQPAATPVVDPAAAAVINASQPTAADW